MKIAFMTSRTRCEKFSDPSMIPEGAELVFFDQGYTAEEVIARAGDAEFAVIDAVLPFTAEMIAGMPNLKMIHSEGVGYAAIDIEAAAKRGIPVCNNQGVNAPQVAEHTVMLILTVLRRFAEGEAGDFRWSSPVSLAQQAGIAPDQIRFSDFRRADVVTVSYAALAAEMKGGSGETLAQSLVRRGVLSQDALGKYYDPNALKNRAMGAPYAENVTAFYNTLRLPQGIDISGQPVRFYNSVALIGDAGYELFGFLPTYAQNTAEKIAAGAAAVEGKARVFGIIVPNRLGAVLSYEDADRICRSEKNETETVRYFNEQMGDKVCAVDAITNLRLHNDEYIFFRTDHHWTALGSYYAYEAWAKAAGVAPVPLENFDTKEYTGHLGLFNSMCEFPASMRANPDTVVAYIPHSSFTCEPAGAMDFTGWGYNTFIGGDRPITTIVNNDITDDSACVLVKDSYGNPFAVWLTQHYHTVYVIDYRYYHNNWDYLTFSRFADEKGVDDFIILLPMTLSMSGYTATCLDKYCR